MFAFGLYNCIASAWIGGVWGMDGAVLRYADVFKPPIPLRCAVPEAFDGAGRR